MRFIKFNNKYLNVKLIDAAYAYSFDYINEHGETAYRHYVHVGTAYQEYDTQEEAQEALQKVLNHLEIIE